MANKGVNKVFLLGNLGKDPEVRYLPNGNAVTNFSIATSESWKDKNTGQQQEKVEWHRIVIFGKLAEIAGEYLKKGSQVFIQGKLQTNKWQDQDGKDRYTTEIVASEMQMIGSRGNNSSSGNQQEAGGNDSNEQAPQQSAVANYGGFDDFDDDIPFMRIADKSLYII